eukprot:148047_1
MDTWDQDALIDWVQNSAKFTDTQKQQIIDAVKKEGLAGADMCNASKKEIKDELGINGIVAGKFVRVMAEERNKINKYNPKTINEGEVTTNVDNVELDFGYEYKHDNISSIKKGILVDRGIEVDNDEKEKEPLVRYYSGVDGNSQLDALESKMKEYCYDKHIEQYEFYEDKERKKKVSKDNYTTVISNIWKPDEKTEDEQTENDNNCYIVYAKKKKKSRNSQIIL